MSRQGVQKGRTPNKPLKKAQYGPRASIPPSRAGSLQTRQMTGSQGRNTALTPGRAANDTRIQYVAPPEYDTVGLMNLIQTYLDKTGLEKNFFQLLHLLLQREELPYNPYSDLALKLRPYAESIKRHKGYWFWTIPLKETSLLNLYTIKSSEAVWGLKSILRTVNVGALQKYRWLIEDVTPKQDSMFQKEGYSTQVMAALVGAAVFHGSFYSECYIVQVRLEYLVTGSDLGTGVEIFINSIMLDIDTMAEGHTPHVLLGLNVPVEDDEVWEQQFWDIESISDNKENLLQLISNAVGFSKNIVAECIFKVDPSQKSYIRGQKQYCLNFITVVENNLKEEGLQSFAEFPMGSLHEGVFLNQTQAEAYISIFAPQTSAADTENIKRTSARPAKSTTRGQENGRKRPSMVIEDDRTLIHRHVHARIEQMKPTKIRIDGFRIGEDAGFGPFAWQITSPIKSNLQRRIAQFHPQAQLFDIVYHVLLLGLMDSHDRSTELVMVGKAMVAEVNRLLQPSDFDISSSTYIDQQGAPLGDGTDIYKHGWKMNRSKVMRNQYITDTHLDEVWHGFLVSLKDSMFMPANPYPQFLGLMRACCMKMDLFYEKVSTLESRLMTSGIYIIDANNFIFHLPGCDAFGPESALIMMDPGAYVPIYKLIEENLTNKSYIHRKGPYRVGICLGMVAPSTLYGKMSPYLHSIELHEHYYIQGPLGCEADARQLFGRMVQAHVAEMIDLASFPVYGIVMGNDKIRWSWVDIINKRQGFWEELEMVCARKEPIVLKAYIKTEDWRYLRVNKYFLLHFITDDSLENTKYFPENPAIFYETVFFTKERAAFHYQNDGPPRGGNPNSLTNARIVGQYLDREILRTQEEADWIMAYRYLLLKSLITKRDSGAAAEAWRMFHSVAGQAAYVASLCESLQDLVFLTLEYMEYSSQNELRVAPEEGDGDKYQPPPAQEETPIIESIEEIKQMFLGLTAMIGGDMHSTSTHAKSAIVKAQQGIDVRPSSVASQSLVDPDRFRRSRPKATKKILEDEMLYA
ncbi:hypothetical protein C0Q70_08219 [Pomacea canaliculata]|uniref:Uncharacterized protein n=1 Tax=Pomacea canaliculata TaxID=400727 RepID=A0A2T7PH72_POMCA|nr:hypothetical protein C0Q70_08219 [Pomacea canaliculata]